MARRLRIGLTGGIASGKSTAAQRFVELGVPVLDADESARAVVAPGQPGLAAVVEKFGAGVLTAEGALDRRALRNLIFADAGLRRELGLILHPLIRADMEQKAAVAAGDYLVLAIPLLIEQPREPGPVDRILVIDVDAALQLERVMARDSNSRTEAQAILSAQATRAARLAAADDVLVNSGTVEELRRGVDVLHERYRALARGPAAAF